MIGEVQTRAGDLGLVTVPALLDPITDRHRPAVVKWQKVTQTVRATPMTAGLSVIGGSPSQVIVIDIDPRNGGNNTLEELPPLTDTFKVFTPGGVHHYYRTDMVVRKKIHGLGPGVDVLSDGSAPTLWGRRASGESYDPQFQEPSPLPQWLVDRLSELRTAPPTQGAAPAVGDMCEVMAGQVGALQARVSSGDRMETLRAVRAVANLAENGHTGSDTLLALLVDHYAAGRAAKETEDGRPRPSHESFNDFMRMVASVFASTDCSTTDPCGAVHLLRKWGESVVHHKITGV